MKQEYLPISAQNIDRFAPLYVAVFNAAPWHDGWSLPIVQERLRFLALAPKFMGLGLLQDGEPIAMVFGAGDRVMAGWGLHLQEMCVAAEFQGRGHGRALMTEFESVLKAASYVGISLQTNLDAPALRFYEHLGYRQFGNVSLRTRL